jgi:hypothetical protein
LPKNTSLDLRLLKEQEAKLSALRAALVEGENSGSSTAFDFDRFIASKRSAEQSLPTHKELWAVSRRLRENLPHFLVFPPQRG